MLPGLLPYSPASLFHLLCTVIPGCFPSNSQYLCLFFGGPALNCKFCHLAGTQRTVSCYEFTPLGRWVRCGRAANDWLVLCWCVLRCVTLHRVVLCCKYYSFLSRWLMWDSPLPVSSHPMGGAVVSLTWILAWFRTFAWHLYLPAHTFWLCLWFSLGLLLMSQFHISLHLRSTFGELV